MQQRSQSPPGGSVPVLSFLTTGWVCVPGTRSAERLLGEGHNPQDAPEEPGDTPVAS